ncbi:MAG: hypothetical protein OXI81_12700 [Paracoccaceae bacterium]|nr:hypothetical protein [Paracoccaceae bacterium]
MARDHAMSAKKETFAGLDRSVDEFRRWVLSDWKSPTTRALLAEFFVRCITSTDSESAEDWNYVDIEWADGTTLEVKCSAYLQPKREGKLVQTPPRFDIGKKIWAWSNRKGDWLPEPDEPRRWADIYVLCLEKETDPDSYNPLDLSQWEAFVIPTSRLDENFPDQKTVSVKRLLQEGFQPVGFDRLGPEIERIRQTVTANTAKN